MTAPDQQNPGLFGMPTQGGMGNAPVQYEQMQQPQTQTVGNPGVVVSADVERTGDYEDYWGFEQNHEFVLPDGKQRIIFKTLTEGDLARYNNNLKRDVVVEKRTGDARFRIDQSAERLALIMVAVVDWTLMKRQRDGSWVRAKFNNAPGGELEQWVKGSNPKIVAELEKAIRDKNEFLMQGDPETVEQVDRQIKELQELREKLLDRQRGEESSAAR